MNLILQTPREIENGERVTTTSPLLPRIKKWPADRCHREPSGGDQRPQDNSWVQASELVGHFMALVCVLLNIYNHSGPSEHEQEDVFPLVRHSIGCFFH
jgi:hypothetical protein